MLGWGEGEFSKLLNYLDEKFKSYFPLVPDSHLHLRAVSVLGMSSEAASLHISHLKQREEPLPFSCSTWLQVKRAVGRRRAGWGQPPRRARSEVGFHSCPHTRSAVGTHIKPLTQAKLGDPAGSLLFASN